MKEGYLSSASGLTMHTMSGMLSTAISIRQLGESDWALYRELRLEALRAEPGVFSSNYTTEHAEPDSSQPRSPSIFISVKLSKS